MGEKKSRRVEDDIMAHRSYVMGWLKIRSNTHEGEPHFLRLKQLRAIIIYNCNIIIMAHRKKYGAKSLL